MSREIKFRVWDNHLKNFVKGDLFFEQIDQGTFEPDCYHDEDGEIHSMKFCQRKLDRYHGYSIQQYIGLKDSEGKEIYEGDLLLLNSDSSIEHIYRIDYHQGSFVLPYVYRRLKGSELFEPVGRIYNSKTFDDCEIIGNIKQNPIEIL